MEKEMNTRKAAKESVLLEVPCTAGNGRVRCNDSESSDGEELGTGRGLQVPQSLACPKTSLVSVRIRVLSASRYSSAILQGSFERRWCVDDKLWSNLGQDTLNLWESACGHLKVWDLMPELCIGMQ